MNSYYDQELKRVQMRVYDLEQRMETVEDRTQEPEIIPKKISKTLRFVNRLASIYAMIKK
jgi:hypothetical protein